MWFVIHIIYIFFARCICVNFRFIVFNTITSGELHGSPLLVKFYVFLSVRQNVQFMTVRKETKDLKHKNSIRFLKIIPTVDIIEIRYLKKKKSNWFFRIASMELASII